MVEETVKNGGGKHLIDSLMKWWSFCPSTPASRPAINNISSDNRIAAVISPLDEHVGTDWHRSASGACPPQRSPLGLRQLVMPISPPAPIPAVPAARHI